MKKARKTVPPWNAPGAGGGLIAQATPPRRRGLQAGPRLGLALALALGGALSVGPPAMQARSTAQVSAAPGDPPCPLITIGNMVIDICSISDINEPSTLDTGASMIVIDVQEGTVTPTSAPAPAPAPAATSSPIVVVGGGSSNPPAATATAVPPVSTSAGTGGSVSTPVPSATAAPARPVGTATYVPTNTPIPNPAGSATPTAAGQTATAEATGGTATAEETATVEPTVATEVRVSNKPRTVVGGRKTACSQDDRTMPLAVGCEVIGALSAPGATVIITLTDPLGAQQTYTDSSANTLKYHGHTHHIFKVSYWPPLNAKHGSPLTIVTVMVTAQMPDGTMLAPAKTRFVTIRPSHL